MVQRHYQLSGRCGRVTVTVLATSLAKDGATTPSVSRHCRVVASDRQETRNRWAPETVEAREQRLAGQRAARRKERLALESAEADISTQGCNNNTCRSTCKIEMHVQYNRTYSIHVHTGMYINSYIHVLPL